MADVPVQTYIVARKENDAVGPFNKLDEAKASAHSLMEHGDECTIEVYAAVGAVAPTVTLRWDEGLEEWVAR